MIEIKSPWKTVADREKWVARGASFVAKVKATKVVWFPPKPVEISKKASSTAEEATRRPTGAAKKTTTDTKKLTNPVRRKKT